MLLRFFRINDPYRLLALLILLVLFSLPHLIQPAMSTLQELRNFVLGESIHDGKLMYIGIVDSTPPLTALLMGITDWIFGRSLFGQHLLALFMLVFQASFFAVLLINNKAYNDNTYVPALIFGLLCFFSFDMLSFSPELIGSTLLLFALNNLFKEIEFRIEKDEIILNLGVFLGLATLVIFSYLIFLFAVILILFVFTRLTLRKLFLMLFGFALPHGILICLYYLLGETTALFQYYYLPNLTVSGKMLIDFKSILVLGALPGIYFVLSLFVLNREARFTKYQSQLFQVMFQWLLVCIIQIFVAREFTAHSLIIFIPSLAYFISHYLLLIRRNWIAEGMLWIFLFGLLTFNYGARYGRIKSVDYGGFFPKPSVLAKELSNVRVMVLSDDLSVYEQCRMAGSFLDWKLSREILEEPGYYENVLMVERAFKSDPPDKVIDPDNLMAKFLERIPDINTRYKRIGALYVRQGDKQ